MKTEKNLFQSLKGKCFFDEPISKHTTFQIGGTVDVFIEPIDTDDLIYVLREVREAKMSWKIIGNGSNILSCEKKLPQAVIKIGHLNNVYRDGNNVIAFGGAGLNKVVNFAAEEGLAGLEYFIGIPASVGGAVKCNAGAHGSCISNPLKELEIIDKDGNIRVMQKDEINFKYRGSDINDQTIIFKTVFSLAPENSQDVKTRIVNFLSYRKEMIPPEPSAGCVFKNPPQISAGRVIDRLGLKGFTIGQAMVSYKHANIIINLGGAKAEEVIKLMSHIKNEVYMKEEIKLEPEIIIWGES